MVNHHRRVVAIVTTAVAVAEEMLHRRIKGDTETSLVHPFVTAAMPRCSTFAHNAAYSTHSGPDGQPALTREFFDHFWAHAGNDCSSHTYVR